MFEEKVGELDALSPSGSVRKRRDAEEADDYASKTLLLAGKIKHARVKAGLTQQKLGERCGMQQSYISSIERGRVHLSVEALDRLTRALGMDLHIDFI